MRIVLPICLLLFMTSSVRAQTVQIDRIDIVQYGIYTADETNCQRDDQGVLRCDRVNVRLAASTTTIPAQIGVHFGVNYRVTGAPSGAPVSLKTTWIYPPGVRSPSAGPIAHLDGARALKIGDTIHTDYAFDDPWELVPGQWTYQLWYGDRKLAEKTFTVVRQ